MATKREITVSEFMEQHSGALQEWLEDRHGKGTSHPVDLYASSEVFFSVAWHIVYNYSDNNED